MLEGIRAAGALRFCLSAADSVQAIQAYGPELQLFEMRCWQGHEISETQLGDLDELAAVWQESEGQSARLSVSDLEDVFRRLELDARKRGRSADVSMSTRRQVVFDAHGRCMFEGCGADLTIDPVTGTPGNFAYLAHNVGIVPKGVHAESSTSPVA